MWRTHPAAFLAQLTSADVNADLCATSHYADTLRTHGVANVAMIRVDPRYERCYCVGASEDPDAKVMVMVVVVVVMVVVMVMVMVMVIVMMMVMVMLRQTWVGSGPSLPDAAQWYT